MNDYTNYLITLKPKSSVITPLHSDTLFGHIAWAIRYIKGEEKLCHFLDKYKDNENAPFLISDGFPSNYLPKPIFKELPFSQLSQLIHESLEIEGLPKNEINLTAIIKVLRKQQFINKEVFENLRKNFTCESCTRELIKELNLKETIGNQLSKNKIGIDQVSLHNTVNRLSWTVEDGLFQQTETFYQNKISFQVYIKTNYFAENDIRSFFQFIEHSGYGRDKSTGKGHFEITVEQKKDLTDFNDENAFMLLSHYVPNAEAPQKGYYKLTTKYGRLGGDFANSVIPGIQKYYGNSKAHIHPFKKPLLMMTPGSIFWGKPSYHYGMLLGGKNRSKELHIHKFPNICHYAYGFPLGLKTDEEEFIK